MSMIQATDGLKSGRSNYISAVQTRGIEPISTGNLELRLAKTKQEIEAAQRLRYRVFYEEMGALPDDRILKNKLDFDELDEEADHLIVFDKGLPEPLYNGCSSAVVGTYRLLQKHHLSNQRSFYTAREFDISTLLNFPGNLLELGRSCVDAKYRNKAILQLMWQGIASYMFCNNIELMFGCASFPSRDPNKHRDALNYLSSYHKAPSAICPQALPEHYIDMRGEPSEIKNKRSIIFGLPPLIKGYLRIGAWVGDGAVIDHQFNTTDVCIIVKTNELPDRYRSHYGRKFNIP
ncbi:MAG: GNAT family N-acyltransferase [Pseudomonadota bacterium]|nr:GNAT family N-acyltransferase [Pseudomonadota bacterium]